MTTKIIGKLKKKSIPPIVIDSELKDDWIKAVATKRKKKNKKGK